MLFTSTAPRSLNRSSSSETGWGKASPPAPFSLLRKKRISPRLVVETGVVISMLRPSSLAPNRYAANALNAAPPLATSSIEYGSPTFAMLVDATSYAPYSRISYPSPLFTTVNSGPTRFSGVSENTFLASAATSAACLLMRLGMRDGSARSPWMSSICFWACLEKASKTREPSFGTRVGSSPAMSATGLPFLLAWPAGEALLMVSAIVGRISEVICRATARVPS
mmetsp:Transcript_43250/g.131654  ORF Transcript_43250/g.131654 Transcript_43250/m.131654 type:complete len:224 (+) Transcript_43250:518-1189(+)